MRSLYNVNIGLLFVQHSIGFSASWAFTSNCPYTRPFRTRLASQPPNRLNDGQIIDESDGEGNLQPKKKVRCFDFPPYYYKEKNGKQMKKMRVKISSSDDNEKIYERQTTPYKSIKKSTFWLLESIEKSAVRTRLLENRSYGQKESYSADNVEKPPSLDDIASATRKNSPWDTFWISVPARLLTFAAAYFAFPYLTQILNFFVTMPPDQLDDITSKFGPVIAILYGTFVSLTLSILYERQRKIQESVGLEASFLVHITRAMLSLFRQDKNRSITAAQCVADQIRTLVFSSRGEELMLLMYADPYGRLFDLISEFEESADEESLNRRGALLGNSRDTVKDLMRARANRLSDEALALPPTHFLVLSLLTILILMSYAINTLPTTDRLGAPSEESSLIFGLLTTTYVLFYNFAFDLNDPFTGVYQLRRSTAATHMLEVKWLLVNHPNTRGEIEFGRADEVESDTVLVQTPGVGEFWFEKDDLFVDN